jgi:hypothetical protein
MQRVAAPEPPCVGRQEPEPWEHVAAWSREMGARVMGHVAPPELPRAGRRELKPWGHMTAPKLPQASKREPGPWDTRAHVAVLSFVLI